jgi:hypothetical protein
VLSFGRLRDIIKSCGLAKMKRVAYPWGRPIPITVETVERTRHVQDYHK